MKKYLLFMIYLIIFLYIFIYLLSHFNYTTLDSDSSKFDKSDFPNNYIEHIKSKIKEGYERIFISSHKDVRNALVENNLPFILIYPSIELKEEYLDRYQKRGSSNNFIKLLSDNWENWLNECKSQKGCHHIELKSGEFISDVI